jgi:hypothetical protein
MDAFIDDGTASVARLPTRREIACVQAFQLGLLPWRESHHSLREQPAQDERLRAIDTGRSGSYGALLSAHPAAGLLVGAPAGISLAGRTQCEAVASGGRCLLSCRARERAFVATSSTPTAVHETVLRRIKPKRRPAERRGHQIAAHVNRTVGSRA